MKSWHSYPSIYNLGHKAVVDILNWPVMVQEKVDGSQFSFGVDDDGSILIRSKGATMYVEGDGSATVFANGGVVLSSTVSTGGGFIVSTGTITFLTSATQDGATDWELWYIPIDDGAAVS